MPICSEGELKAAIAADRIVALTLDANIFEQKGFSYAGQALQALSTLKTKPLEFILAGTVAQETVARHADKIEEATRQLKRAAKAAVGLYDTPSPTPAEILTDVSRGQTPTGAAQEQLDAFVAAMDGAVIDDAALVETRDLFEAYFGKAAPFGAGKKKSEFPDALSLMALEASANARDPDKGILVVSNDGDWRKFCAASSNLYHVGTLEEALDIVTDAPAAVRRAIVEWLAPQGAGRAELQSALSGHIERVDFSVEAILTQGSVEAHAWAGSLETIVWDDDPDIDVLEVRDRDDGMLEVVVSLTVLLHTKVPIELSFSVYDSIDRQSLGMGGREVDCAHETFGHVTLTIQLADFEGTTQSIDIEETELDLADTEIDLGEVSLFEPEDYEV